MRAEPAPDPPAWVVDSELVAEWERLWASGVSVLWGHDVHDAVARLAAFRVTFRSHLGVNVDTMSRLHPQITRLEENLLLTAKAQRAAGIELSDAPPSAEDQEDELARKREEMMRRAGLGG